MNKELEEAKKFLKHIKESQKDLEDCKTTIFYKNENKAIETVLTALENSIPKQIVEKYLKEIKDRYLTKPEDIQNETGATYNYYLGKVDILQELLEGK